MPTTNTTIEVAGRAWPVIIEPDPDAGGYIITCPALPGCYTQGDTIHDALTNIREAIALCLDDND